MALAPNIVSPYANGMGTVMNEIYDDAVAPRTFMFLWRG